ncbi:hypothetical protein BGP_0305 [Beggiatoa sp. PS]|nr:hypothetical protein BGP_0305 [Beggiatoa sp. PS]
MFILLGLGLTKLYLGLQYNHPIFFLVLLLIALPIITVWFLKPHPNTTLGRRYQEQLIQHFEWLQSTNTDEMNPALMVALFGVTALVGFEAFAPFEETFAQSTTSSISSGGCGGSDGGCGGGCGGCG